MRLLKRYEAWEESGKPSETEEKLAFSVKTPNKAKDTGNTSKEPENKAAEGDNTFGKFYLHIYIYIYT